MGFGDGARALQIPSGMMRVEIASAVERIGAAVANEHSLIEVSLESNLHDDLDRSHCRTIYRLRIDCSLGTTAASDHIIAGGCEVPGHRKQREVVLVVDDEPLVRLDASETLYGAGFEACKAASVREALTVLDERPVTAISA